MNQFWGDDSWRNDAYAESLQQDLFTSEPKRVKRPNVEVAAAFCKRLREVAQFEFVAEPLPMCNSSKAVVYYLLFASPKIVANKIITDIFKKYR